MRRRRYKGQTDVSMTTNNNNNVARLIAQLISKLIFTKNETLTKRKCQGSVYTNVHIYTYYVCTHKYILKYLLVLSVNHKMNIQKCMKIFTQECVIWVNVVAGANEKYAKMTIAERKAAAAQEQKIP